MSDKSDKEVVEFFLKYLRMLRGYKNMNIFKIIMIFCLLFIPLPFIDNYTAAQEMMNKMENTPLTCEKPGWFPSGFGLKDHHVFQHGGYYYIVSIYLPGEKQFAYARSLDLCTWEDLGPILTASSSDGWESLAKWAPFVLEENGVYYMYYTGVTESYTQSIMVATSSNPADPNSWTQRGMIFQPNHDNMIWQAGRWADCRDPTVVKIDNVYYMLYTGLDETGGIVGVATALSPLGPWIDWGAITPPVMNSMLESPTLVQYGHFYYLFYNNTAAKGERYRYGPAPTGPWSIEYPLTPGWAHEVWQDSMGEWRTSYLTNYTISISKLSWDELLFPPQPYIGYQRFHVFSPLIIR